MNNTTWDVLDINLYQRKEFNEQNTILANAF